MSTASVSTAPQVAGVSTPPVVTVSRTSQVAARLSIAAAALFLLLLAALHVLEPEVNPGWQMISDYELGRYGCVMVLAFVSLAASSASLVITLRPHVHTVAGAIGLGCLLVCAAAQLGGGIFITDPITATSDQASPHGTLHGFSALMGMASMPFAAGLLSWCLARRPIWATMRGRLLGTAGLIWLSLVVFGASIAVLLPRGGGTFGPNVVIGWQNRLMVLAYCAWVVTAAWRPALAARANRHHTPLPRLFRETGQE